jgi:hypothetical protein
VRIRTEWKSEFSFGWSGCDWILPFVFIFICFLFKGGRGSVLLVTSQMSCFIRPTLFLHTFLLLALIKDHNMG